MKDWKTSEVDHKLLLARHRSGGYSRHTVDKLIIHHNADNFSIHGVHDAWQTCPESAHYQVTSEEQVG